MPSKFNLFKSNKSQASLSTSQDQRYSTQRPVESPLPSPGYRQTPFSPPPPRSPYSTQEREDQFVEQRSEDQDRVDYSIGNNLSRPSRSQSQRYSQSVHNGQPTVNLVVEPQGDPRALYPAPASAETQQDPEPKRSRRHILDRFSTSSKETQPSSGLGRSTTVRRKDPPPPTKRPQHSPTEEQHWRSARSSTSNLPQSSEEVEAERGLEPYLVEGTDLSPPVPAKDPSQRLNTLQASNRYSSQGRVPLQSLNTDPATRDQLQQGRGEFVPPQRGTSFHPPPQFQPASPNPPPGSSHYQAYNPHQSSHHNSPQSSENQRPTDLASQLAYQQQLDSQSGRPASQQSSNRPSSPQQLQAYEPPLQAQSGKGPALPIHSQQPLGPMAPPAGQSSNTRRSVDAAALSARSGQPKEPSSLQAYGQNGLGQSQGSTPVSAHFATSPPSAVPQIQNYGGGPPQQQQPGQQGAGDHGRSTPPPARSATDLAGLDQPQLVAKYEELQTKYIKVKKYYFDKDAQVQQLQNTLAHQRLAQSRTSLDDSEYSTRFTRLDGAINNLSFNIRKDWKAIPQWLQTCVNQDAHRTGKQEMTAVGRACVSKWIVDEILERYFHPGLEPALSSQLKIIEKNLRKFAPPLHSTEEEDSLLVRISNWRLTTLDGLQEVLSSTESAEYRSQLTEYLVKKLIADLQKNLKDPPPPGLEGGVSMIVELAVGIAANLPLESRDVYVEYPMPGATIVPDYMKIESLPALTNPGSIADPADTDMASTDASSTTSDPKDAITESASKDPDLAASKEQSKKKGMLGGLGLLNKKPASAPGQGEGLPGKAGGEGSQVSLTQQGQRPGSAAGTAKEGEAQKVRFAAFMMVEVRQRSILFKAPVYT
ncbi:MAG: hypothetical protein M1827_006065 [Pycnora praestabilis]|nr:MAG: hypothetical protein M1827_006065 [Pycnora praestabilis]